MQRKSMLKFSLMPAFILSLCNASLFADKRPADTNTIQEAMNPSARCYMGNGFEVSADFLYWKAEQPDLPYAFVNTNPELQDVGFLSYIDYEWSPGVRVGLGWNTDYDGWNLNANWTWLRNKSSSSVNYVTEPETAFPLFIDLRGVHIPSLFIHNTTTVPPEYIPNNIGFASAKASSKMVYNMLDIQLGKPYAVSKKLNLTPSIGVQGGWISRHLNLLYESVPLPIDDVTLNMNYQTKYWGVGPRFGLNTDWKLGNSGFELFGNFGTTLLFGKSYDERLHNRGSNIYHQPDSEDLWNIKAKSNRSRIVPAMQMALGLGWNKCFNHRSHDYYVNLDAAWEVNYFWNLQNFFQLQGNQAAYNFPSSLDLCGLTLHGGFGF